MPITKHNICLLSLTILSMLMGIHLYNKWPSYPFAPDSAEYIEQARSLLSSGSALTTPFFLTHPDEDVVDNRLFPIAYPAIIAAISALGLDAKIVAACINQVSSIFLAWFLFYGFRAALGSVFASLLAVFSLLSPAILLYAPMALSDVFALCVVTAAAGLLINAQSGWAYFSAGLLAGLAYAIRNAHLALLLSIAMYFLCMYLLDYGSKAAIKIYQQALTCLLGMAVVLVPVLTRNVLIYGSLNPYHMPPSTISFAENAKTFLQAILSDFLAYNDTPTHQSWWPYELVGLILIGASVIWYFRYAVWQHLSDIQKKSSLFALIYLISGATLVIAARSRYQWGELINIRHTLQYTPFIWVIFLGIVLEVQRRQPKVSWLIIGLLGISHISYAFTFGFMHADKVEPHLSSIFKVGEKHLCAQTPGVALVSNWGYMFRLECGAHVREIASIHISSNAVERKVNGSQSGYDTMLSAIIDIKQKLLHKPIFIGFFPGRSGFEASDFPISTADKNQLLDYGWLIVRNDANALLISHP